MTSWRALASLAIALVAIGTMACEPPVPAVPGADGGAPQVGCQGVPDSICKQALDTMGAAQGTVAQVVVQCSQPVCTEQSGEADVLIVFRDGRQTTSKYGWGAAPAVPEPIPVITPPALAVQPECQGLPFQQCIEMATNGLDGNTADAVGKITVHCSAVCTATDGSGETTYEFVDGRPRVTVGWNYQSGG